MKNKYFKPVLIGTGLLFFGGLASKVLNKHSKNLRPISKFTENCLGPIVPNEKDGTSTYVPYSHELIELSEDKYNK
ncbi:MAG: hypothetical protein WDZ62_02405 [Candidatus Pacearchaeota archaeon]